MRGKLKIIEKTKVFGIFGCPVHHSLSPAMHNAAFQHLSLDGCYLPFEIRPDHLLTAVQAIVPLGLGGVNVTVPHKETVIPFLHELSPMAELIGAVNTIEVQGERLVGHNTDGLGFIRALQEEGVSVSGKRVMILGAGGSAKAGAVQMASSGVSHINFANRTPDRASTVMGHLKRHFPTLSIKVVDLSPDTLEQALSETDILVNATSVGLKSEDQPLVPLRALRPGLSVYDLIYNPPETPLLKNARVAGARSINGWGMLLHQGVLAFEIWTGRKAPVSVMRNALHEAMRHDGH
ncbi:MAG: shikimate dehydrogenase [Nitrospirae bacterium]|nr:shikimate dehydrogenase [Nitrospirota bacterium]